MQQSFITQRDRCFITKWDGFITKCDSFCKMPRLLQNAITKCVRTHMNVLGTLNVKRVCMSTFVWKIKVNKKDINYFSVLHNLEQVEY